MVLVCFDLHHYHFAEVGTMSNKESGTLCSVAMATVRHGSQEIWTRWCRQFCDSSWILYDFLGC